MNTITNAETLTIVTGSKSGKVHRLKNDEISLGSHKSNTIQLQGEYVSDYHAVIKRRNDGIRVIKNLSVNNTIVNQAIVDERPLADGDVVQIGADNLLRFNIEENKSAIKEKKKKIMASSGGQGLLKNKLLITGLLVYLSLILGAVLFFGSNENINKAELTYEKVESLLKSTDTYIANMPNIGEVDDLNQNYTLSNDIDKSSDFFEIRKLQDQVNFDENKFNQHKNVILETISDSLNQAWHLESTKQHQLAIKEYRDILQIIPDINSPVSKYAVRKIRYLNNL